MKLIDLAVELGFSVPTILPRIVSLSDEFFCANPGAVELSQDLERKVRAQLSGAEVAKSSPRLRPSRPKRQASKQARKVATARATVTSLATEYRLRPEQLLETAHSMGFRDLGPKSVLSIAQLEQLHKALNPDVTTRFGDSSSATLETALQKASPLRVSGPSTKRRVGHNSGRIRIEILARNWNCPLETIAEACRCARVEIFGEDTPRVAIANVGVVEAGVSAIREVREKWGDRDAIRLTKIALYLERDLATIRQVCAEESIIVDRRDHVAALDAARVILLFRLVDTSQADDSTTDKDPSSQLSSDAARTVVTHPAMSLNGMTLEDQDFSNEDLSGVSFVGCSLVRAKFVNTDLRGADFTGAILRYACFDGALIDGACFTRADLRWAILRDTTYDKSQFAESLLDGTILPGRESKT
mgnify:CR=1 FL=1